MTFGIVTIEGKKNGLGDRSGYVVMPENVIHREEGAP